MVAILSFVALFFLYTKFRANTEKDEFPIASSLLLCEAYFLSFWLVSAEILDFHSKFWIPIFWSVGALLVGYLSFLLRNSALRFAAYLTFFIVFFRLLLYEGKIDIQTHTPLFNVRVLSFIVSVLAMGIFVALFQRKKEELPKEEAGVVQPTIFLAINFLLLFLLSSEVLDVFNKQFSELSKAMQKKEYTHYANLKNSFLSVAWTVYAIILLIIGIIRRSTAERFLAVALFGVIIFKVFLLDTANLNNFFRFVSFITLGGILLLAGYLYYRYRDRITQFIQAGTAEEKLK